MSTEALPLRLLPETAQLEVVKRFDGFSLIAFSFTSTKSKVQVQSLNWKTAKLYVAVKGTLLTIFIDIDHRRRVYERDYVTIDYSIGRDEDPDQLVSLDTVPDHIVIDGQYRWEHLGLSFNQIFQHVQSLFKHVKEYALYAIMTEVFDTRAIRNLAPIWSYLKINYLSSEYILRLIDLFLQNVNGLIFWSTPDERLPQRIHIQNFHELVLSSSHQPSLDDVLIMTSRDITIWDWTVKDGNRLIRSWIRGSNPRMRIANINLKSFDLNVQGLLKGIQHQILQEEVLKQMARNVVEDTKDAVDAQRYGLNREYRRVVIRNNKGISAVVSMHTYREDHLSANFWIHVEKS